MADVEIDRFDVAATLFPEYPPGFPYDNFDVKELILPDGDDMGINSDDDDVDVEEIETETGFGNIIVVDGLPVITPEKLEKLSAVVFKLASRFGTIREGGLVMPMDNAKGTTKGFCFVEYSSVQEAAAAKEQLQAYKLDKNHTLTANMFDDVEKYMKVPDEYVPMQVAPFNPVTELQSWMTDRLGRDQFVVRHGVQEVEVYWNDGKRFRPEEAYKRQGWTETFVQWTPQGNYLITMHRQGVALWGGPEYKRAARIAHPNVSLIDISPNERYMITYSSYEAPDPREPPRCLMNIFDTRTTKLVRKFEAPIDDFAIGAAAGAQGTLIWPVFKWAGGKQDQFMARLDKDGIAIYTAPDMVKLDKKNLKLERAQDVSFSPSEPLMSVYLAGEKEQPGKLLMYQLPEKKEIRSRSYMGAQDLKMFWHPQGDFLALKIEKTTKSKKNIITNLEILALREKDYPVDAGEHLEFKDRVQMIAWEPKGTRFVVVHGDTATPTVSFYQAPVGKGSTTKHLASYQNKKCNAVFWSPAGRNVVLAGLKQHNGHLEFFNADELETLATEQHFMCSDVQWDPTGRYVATSVNSMQQMDTGYMMWSFNGKQLYNVPKDKFHQLLWRPRVPSLLPAEKEAEILKNLKSYSKRYDEEDEALLQQADQDVLLERKQLLTDWEGWYESKQAYITKLKDFKGEMYGDLYGEKPYKMERVTVEQTLDVREEPFQH